MILTTTTTMTTYTTMPRYSYLFSLKLLLFLLVFRSYCDGLKIPFLRLSSSSSSLSSSSHQLFASKAATTKTTTTNNNNIDDDSIDTTSETLTSLISFSLSSTSPPPPSWDDLETLLHEKLQQQQRAQETPLVTLYRDTNGWCPFCERVWLALRVKQIPYQESLISLQNKPQWYKELVPTTLVPAVLFHHDDDQGGENSNNDNDNITKKKTTRRTIVWESIDILKMLDEQFPNHTPQLVLEGDSNYDHAMKLHEELLQAGLAYQFASRNTTLTVEDIQERKFKFISKLDELEAMLERNHPLGPFCLGKDFTAIDACMIPGLERWRYQLPITSPDQMNILEGRPFLQKWFDHMDQYEPYVGRVSGDEYSWTATTSMFLRYFGGNETTNPNVAAAIQRADEQSRILTENFATSLISLQGDNRDKNNNVEGDATTTAIFYCLEAAKKLITNHDAVIQDCTYQKDPISQKHILRASNSKIADWVLRHVVFVLLNYHSKKNGEATKITTTTTTTEAIPFLADDDDDDLTNNDDNNNNNNNKQDEEEMDDNTKNWKHDGALAARTVAARLCVPRDMSKPAAKILRAVLAMTANQLEK